MSSILLKEVNLNDIINSNNELLTIKDLLNKVNYNINELYLDKFWNNIENNKWLYLDEELINWLEYNDISKGKEKIVNLLKKHHIIEEDYKVLNNFDYQNFINTDNKSCSPSRGEQDLNNKSWGGSNKIHIIMNSDCFKNICMLVKTKKSKDIRMYFIQLENIFKFYLEYQNLYQKKLLEEKQKELEQTKDKVMDMERDFQHKELEMNEFIYIATNEYYHKQNVYKIGKSVRLNKRLQCLNTFFINGQKMKYIYIFQCHNSRILEQLLFTCLSNYQYNKVNELFNIDLMKLYKIVFNIGCQYNAIINFSNKELFNPNFDQILLNDMPSSQTYPINYQNVSIDTYNELLLKKYVNNKNISNMIMKDFKEFDFNDHMLINNKALAFDTKTKYYYLTYHNKMIYVCTNCGTFKKDKRGFEQHINKRNKCDSQKINLNTIEDIERELNNQKIILYSCEKCDIIFKTNDHYKRHLEINCKKIE